MFIKHFFSFGRVLLILTLIQHQLSFSQEKPNDLTRYNETHLPTGEPTPLYSLFKTLTGLDPLTPPKDVSSKLTFGHPLEDKNQILPVPVLLSDDELALIQKGTEQRAKALIAFFEDMVLGSARIVNEPWFLDPIAVGSVFRSSWADLAILKSLWAGKTAKDISFFYGPDLIRTPNGNWVVIEDNIGSIGGLSDIDDTRLAFFNAVNLHAQAPLATESSMIGFQALIQAFLDAHNIFPTDYPTRVKALLYPDEKELLSITALGLDLEWRRERKVIQDLKIPILNVETITKNVKKVLKRPAPSALINFPITGDTEQIRAQFEFFTKAGIPMTAAPGTDVLSDKTWSPYIAQMIRFYLNEEPILDSPETHLVRQEDAEKLVDSEWVLKLVSGGQGSDVYLFNRFKPADLKTFNSFFVKRNFRSLVFGYGQQYIKQRFVPASFVSLPWADYQIDLRPLTLATGRGVFISKQPWGRASPLTGHGLTNVSQGALQAVVLSESHLRELTCYKALK